MLRRGSIIGVLAFALFGCGGGGEGGGGGGQEQKVYYPAIIRSVTTTAQGFDDSKAYYVDLILDIMSGNSVGDYAVVTVRDEAGTWYGYSAYFLSGSGPADIPINSSYQIPMKLYWYPPTSEAHTYTVTITLVDVEWARSNPGVATYTF